MIGKEEAKVEGVSETSKRDVQGNLMDEYSTIEQDGSKKEKSKGEEGPNIWWRETGLGKRGASD